MIIKGISEQDYAELQSLRAFVEVIQWGAPNGELIGVRYHPNGDWTVEDRVSDGD